MSETLLNEIRAAKPAAPATLQERVRSLAAQEPARAPSLARFDWRRPDRRRLVLVAPAAIAVALVAGTVIGLTRGDVAGDERTAGGGDTAVSSRAFDTEATQKAEAVPETALGGGATLVPPVTGQLQRYEAELRLRVENVEALSDATKRAQRIALQHGGTVASLQYDAPAEGVGAAQITLRVPTARVQSAMAQLTQLGTIVGQSYGIDDLQVQADTLQTQIEQAQRRIAQILTQLESSTLSDENRVVLQSRLNASRQKLTGLREAMRATNAEARTATIYVTLTTEEIQPAAADGDSRLDDVKDVLAWEGIALLYTLVVAGPFLLLGLLVWLVVRLRRRQSEARLLDQN